MTSFLLVIMLTLSRVQITSNNYFRLKDPISLKCFLGIEVVRGPEVLFLYQRSYAREIMDECGMFESKPIEFPMEENHKLVLAKDKDLDELGQDR